MSDRLLLDELSGRTIILANGDFPSHPLPLAVLAKAVRVICCDGAAEKLLATGRRPDLVVGDLDSLPAALRGTLDVCHVSEQETNDLSKAFRYCMAQGYGSPVILGATGLREDHTLGNLSLVADFSEQAPDIRLLTDTGLFLATTTTRTFRCRPGQAISIFSFDPTQRLSSRGLKDPLEHLRLRRWWNATLNVADGDEFQLILEDPGTVLLYFRYIS